jgi:sugar lactone lactonase YvrE
VRRGLAALAVLLLAGCAAPIAQRGPDWPAFAEDPAALAVQFPDSASAARRLLAATHQAGDSASVRAGLARLAASGYAPSQATIDTLAPHVPESEMAALRLRFAANGARVQASRLFATVPAEHRLVEGVAWDARRSRLFAATVVSRALLVHDAQGWHGVEGLEAGSLFGLAVDERRQLLWLASGVVEQTPSPDTAFRGLIAVDLATLRPVRRVPVEGAGSPADIVVAADGTVYASDPNSGAIYRARAGDAALQVLVPAGRLRSPQGLVPAADGRRLYVSDYGYGLAMVSLADGAVSRLESDAGTMLDGIDGLVGHNGRLIAIQNGTNPRRILLLTLSRDGNRIAAARVLESNNPDWSEPTLGALHGDDFLYVADAQWDRYGAGGALQGEGAQRPTAIRLLRPPN